MVQRIPPTRPTRRPCRTATGVALLLASLCIVPSAPAQTGGSDANPSTASSASGDTANRRQEAAAKRLSDSVGIVHTMAAVPGMTPLLAQAHGIYIVPNFGRAALGVGAEGGSGVLMVRRADGTWSNPAFYTIGGVSIGLQAGAEGGPIALVLMNDKAIDSFRKKNNFSLNASAGLTVVNFSRMAQGSTAGDVVAWAGSKGLFGNAVTVGINDIRFNPRLTDALYGKPTTAIAAIDSTEPNPHADALRKALANPPTPTGTGARRP